MNRLIAFMILSFAWACQAPDKTPINLEELTISEIHHAYQNGNFSAEDLTKAYLDRIEALDSSLNSISITNSEALAIAKKLDEEFKKAGKLRPLHGIPLIVKDNINTTGLPTTAGAWPWLIFIRRKMPLSSKKTSGVRSHYHRQIQHGRVGL